MTQLDRPKRESPCDWPVSYAECSGAADRFESCEDREMFEDVASTYLWEWTDRRYGLCPATIRPCRRGCDELGARRNGFYPSGHLGIGGWYPALIGGSWFNIYCGCGQSSCSCGPVYRLRLPGPVGAVTEVRVDGVALAPERYRLDGDTLVRQDGIDWPVCQELGRPDGEPGTWSVSYTHGVPVPMGGQVAAGLLAAELFKAACGDSTCALPRSVTSVTRQGVSIQANRTVLEDAVQKGKTGITLVDMWVASVTTPKRPSIVASPDFNYTPRRSR